MPHFECGAIDHSATSPRALLEHLAEKWNPVSGLKIAIREKKIGQAGGAFWGQ
jgi:hypothetical protein